MADRSTRRFQSHRQAFAIRPGAIALLAGIWLLTLPLLASELRLTPIVKAVHKARPSVVNIRGEKTVNSAGATVTRSESGRRVNGMGTGVVIDPRGYVITNHHVVDGVREIQITLADGQRYTAKLVARHLETDLAIIKINSSESFPVIRIGSSHDLMPGEPVVAVGNAYGYEHTVTRGIISALHRAVQVSDAQFYEDLIQTDASINPGNSGGPLLNIDGEMVGINVAVRAGAQGIGFAIPVSKAMDVAANLVAELTSRETWHGLDVTGSSVEDETGVVVTAVELGSPAAEAGLKPGDLIVEIDKQPTERALDFHRAVLDRKPGQTVRVSIQRDDEPVDLEIILAQTPRRAQPDRGPWWDTLGMELETISSSAFRRQYQTKYRGGLKVTSVRPHGPAHTQGIREGDVLVGMHVWETISEDNVSYIINSPDFTALDSVRVILLRGNQALQGHLSVGLKTARKQ